MKSYVKIDRKVLFEILDNILEWDGGFNYNDCYDDDTPYFCWKWDEKFIKKVRNIRNNS